MHKWLILSTFVVGVLVGYLWRSLPLLGVHAEGELQYQSPGDPAATPTYPPGYYVLSRVYVSGADSSLVGKRIYSTGALASHKHPETHSYPLLPLSGSGTVRK